MDRVPHDAIPEKVRRMVEDVPPQQRLPLPFGQPFPVHLGRVFGSRPLPRDLRVRHVPLQHPLPLPVHGDEAVEVDVVPDRPRRDHRGKAQQKGDRLPCPSTAAAAGPEGTASQEQERGVNHVTTLASVHTPQAAPASAARGVDGALIHRTDSQAASIVNSSSVGSWRTKTTRVTSSGFTASRERRQLAHAKDGTTSRNRKNAARTPTACNSDWKTAAESGEVVSVRRYQPPRRNGNSGGRYTDGVTPSCVNPFPAARFRARDRYSTESYRTSGRGVGLGKEQRRGECQDGDRHHEDRGARTSPPHWKRHRILTPGRRGIRRSPLPPSLSRSRVRGSSRRNRLPPPA